MTKKEFLSLDLKHKIGQTAIVRVRPDNPEMGNDFEKVLNEYGYGAFFLGSEVIRAGNEGRAEVKRTAEFYRKNSFIPPLICGDAEAGFRNILCDEDNFPEQMALGAANDLKLAYNYGKANAIECVECGVNWTFAPVTDININPLNSIVNIRSLSDNPERALPLLKEIIRGMQQNGLMATVKHFPGDGVDYRDQHFVKTANTLSREDWYRYYGNIYKELFAEGASAIMVGHMSLAWYQKGDNYDNKPATLCSELLNGLLKEELGFKGVVVSDALEMGAYEQEYCDREKSEIESFKAGIDMLLWPSRSYFENLEKAVLSGEVSMERLDEALSRIYELKKKAGCFDADFTVEKEIKEETKLFADKIAEELAEKSITLVRDKKNVFSGKREFKKIVIVTESPNEKGYNRLERLRGLFEKEGVKVDLLRNGVTDNWQPKLNAEKIKEYDLVILAMYLRPHEPLGFLDFPDLELVGISKVVNLPAEKTVCVSFGSPYVHKIYCDKIPACINAYGDSLFSMQAFVNAVMGKAEFNYDCPVKIF